MSEERYRTAGNKTIIDSYGGEIKPMSIVATANRLNKLERQLEEAREEIESYKYDLGTLVSIVTDCAYQMSPEECYDTLKQVADHYKKLKEKG